MEARIRSRRRFASRLAARSLAEFQSDRCSQFAASISYHVLFSIFPLAIVVAGASAIVLHATDSRAHAVDTLVRNVPLSAKGADQLRRLLLGATSTSSAAGLLGIVGVVYSASGMMAAIRAAINEAWDVAESRPFLRGKLVDVGLVSLVATLGLASLGVTVALRFADRIASSAGVPGVGWLAWGVGLGAPLLVAFARAALPLPRRPGGRGAPARHVAGGASGGGAPRRGREPVRGLRRPFRGLQRRLRVARRGDRVHVLRLPRRVGLPARRRGGERVAARAGGARAGRGAAAADAGARDGARPMDAASPAAATDAGEVRQTPRGRATKRTRGKEQLCWR